MAPLPHVPTASDFAGLLCFPNEILIQLLSDLPTRALLPVAAVCHHFRDLALGILRARLLKATALKEQSLMLECYHPSAQYTSAPIYFESQNQFYTGYSRFRPTKRERSIRDRYRPHPAGLGLAQGESNRLDSASTVSQEVALDSYELFSQLCTATHLVRDSRPPGVFRSVINVSRGVQVVRVWRDWLAERAVTSSSSVGHILWLDSKQKIGLRVQVKEPSAGPAIINQGEDPAVTYTLEIEELLVRNTYLLLAVEESLSRQDLSHRTFVVNPFT
ncbi:MAG: hypothetical protein M1832_002178 [Thelocarpon impressellum]|nr:MAG: hypothetical protein M1832_002178 [Thelocarpon impressellum]